MPLLSPKPTNILILGASGMLGAALFSTLPRVNPQYHLFGTHRSKSVVPICSERMTLIPLDDVFEASNIREILTEHDIHVVINAIGLIKQIGSGLIDSDYVRLNSWLPHFMSNLCDEVNARFIEISTDCVFTGLNGDYKESDTPDAKDIYGLSKLLGEVKDKTNALTIRTSIIGHESGRAASLVDWFLSTSGTTDGYAKAIFSGFPTVILAKIIGEHILTRPDLQGLYHISAEPINKHNLLELIAEIYEHKVKITPKVKPEINRSLNSDKFRKTTGFTPLDWPMMINVMKNERPLWRHNDD